MGDKNTTDFSAARAAEFDNFYLREECQFEVRALEKWFTPKFTDTKAIELACGTGFWTQFLARTTRGMVALDAFPNDLAIAESRVPVDKVKFMTGDAFKLSPDLGRFNAGFAAHWMSSVPRVRRMAFFQALSTVMVPGAEVVLLDYAFVEGVSAPIADTDADGNTYQLTRLKDGTDIRVLKNYPTEAELRFALGNHGVRTKLTQWDYFWAFEYVAC
ncbi:MAG: class I SAM-dependent methyltransferase [Betaproteobacteria bacterium]|jgi:SAM-dependent methyltransferase|nr:class I SAM-dependent methyltransferase [Betaproteobacteria bacterium]